MASKKKTSSTDEFGNKIPVKTGSKTMRTVRSSGADSTRGSRAGSSLRARGIEKGNTAGRVGSKTMTTARSTGAERKGITGSRSGSSLRARGIETGGIKKAAPKASSYPQSVRAAGAKAVANKSKTSSFRAQRFGGGKRGGSAQVTPRSNQSMAAYEYKKKRPGKY